MLKKVVFAVMSVLLTASHTVAHEAPKTDAAKQEYIDNFVKVFEVNARYFNDDDPGVQYAVKNIGTETIIDLEVTFYFLDKSGNRFGEENFHPLLIGYKRTEPLKPNYTWRSSDITYSSFGNLGDEWSGKVEYEISDIKFAE